MYIIIFTFVLDGAFPNKSISVKNACRLKAPDGELSTIEGYAFRPNEKEEGKLKVVFGVVPRLFQLGGANCKKFILLYAMHVHKHVSSLYRLGGTTGTSDVQW